MKKQFLISSFLVLLLAFAFTAYSQTARLQVIHNAADPAAAAVDIYLNGNLLLDDFAFRAATPFIDAPANTPLEIGVAPGTSSSAADILATIPVTLAAGETYVAIANGVLDPSAFAPNPDGKDTGFKLYVKEMARETTADAKSVDLFVFHGATDAPMVDIAVRDLGTIVDDAPYGAMTDYLNVPLGRFNLDLAVSSDPNTVIGSFAGGFWQSSGGTGAVVFASGFLAPDANQNGRGFGIYAALSNGQVARFSPLETARLQVIHNAADPAAEIVDVYLNGGLLLDDFAFRTATPFIDAPANTPLDIGIAPSTSTSVDDAIAHIEVSLLGGATYVAVANGVIGSGFAANPDGLDIAFTLLADRDVREKAQWVKFVELVVLHGATDAPAVDVLARGTNEPLPPKFDDPIVDNLAYGQFTDLLRLWPRAYTLDITPGSDNSVVVASYDVNLEGLAGISAVVFASGFLSPPDNNNGPAFGLYAALPTGDVVAFPTAPPAQGALASTMATSIDGSAQAPIEYSLSQNYPNPFNPTTTISFSLREATDVSLRVFDLMGREVATLVNGKMTSGQHQVVFDASSLASGKYFYQIEAGSFKAVKSLTLIK